MAPVRPSRPRSEYILSFCRCAKSRNRMNQSFWRVSAFDLYPFKNARARRRVVRWIILYIWALGMIKLMCFFSIPGKRACVCLGLTLTSRTGLVFVKVSFPFALWTSKKGASYFIYVKCSIYLYLFTYAVYSHEQGIWHLKH